MRPDAYTKIVLTVIALLLAALVLRPAVSPIAVQAQTEAPSLYIEPGVTSIRNPENSLETQGKMVIDLKTGEIWGFPTLYTATSKAPVLKPTYLGRFDFTAMKRNN